YSQKSATKEKSSLQDRVASSRDRETTGEPGASATGGASAASTSVLRSLTLPARPLWPEPDFGRPFCWRRKAFPRTLKQPNLAERWWDRADRAAPTRGRGQAFSVPVG